MTCQILRALRTILYHIREPREMRLNDPLRPQVNHQPAYCNARGEPIAPILDLGISFVQPEEADAAQPTLVSITGFWCHHRFVAKYYEIQLPLEELQWFLRDFWQDPEGVMRERFGWSWSDAVAKAPLARIAPSLADLGLL